VINLATLKVFDRRAGNLVNRIASMAVAMIDQCKAEQPNKPTDYRLHCFWAAQAVIPAASGDDHQALGEAALEVIAAGLELDRREMAGAS
jgi:hypothetical protein